MKTPPKAALYFFRWFCHPDLRTPIEGDLMELYDERIASIGKSRADLKFILDVFFLIRRDIIRPTGGTHRLNIYGMIKNYFKTTGRVLLKHKLITTTSLISLIIGVLCFQLINSWVLNELSTNQFHQNIDKIYAVQIRATPQADNSPISTGYFKDFNYENYPQIISSLRIIPYTGDNLKLSHNREEFVTRAFVVDSTFFNFFDFPILYGVSKDLLKDPSGILITESYSKRIFGKQNPIGTVIDIECGLQDSYTVAGVLKDIPSNSSIDFDILIPEHSQDFWPRTASEFFLVNEFFDPVAFNNEIIDLGKTHPQFTESKLSSIPFKNIYFDHPFDNDMYSKYGDMKNVRIMIIIAAFILLISTLIFGNLQTTLQLSNLRSMGIKRVNGASKYDLMIEMFVSRLYFLFITIIAVAGLYELVFPAFLKYLDLQIDRNLTSDLVYLAAVTAIIIAISMVISVFQIMKIEVLKSLRNKLVSFNVAKLQRSLTTVQFTFTIVLIISTIVVFQQFIFMLNKDVGFNADSVISFHSVANKVPYYLEKEKWEKIAKQEKNKYRYFINELTSNPDIIEVSQSEMPVHSIAYPMPWKVMGSSEDYTTQNMMIVDPKYADLLNLEVLRGRFFSDSLDRSRENIVVVNEAAVKYWGIQGDPLNQKIANSYWGAEQEPYTIIGVVKDFHYQHMSNKVKPLMLLYMRNQENSFMVKIQKGKEKETIAYIRELFEEVSPNRRFTYVSLQDELELQYKSEEKLSKLYLLFTVVALLLSAMGLFTFAIHETIRRTKEIGIRKINGASLANIFITLGKTFLKPIVIAYLIASPVSYLLVQNWLDSFANRVGISWWAFASAGVLIVLTAFAAISWQSLVAARKNPVDALRYE